MTHTQLSLLTVLLMLSSSCGTYYARFTKEREFYERKIEEGPYLATRIEWVYVTEGIREGDLLEGGDGRGLIIVIPLIGAFFVVDVVTDTVFLYWDRKKIAISGGDDSRGHESTNTIPLSD